MTLDNYEAHPVNKGDKMQSHLYGSTRLIFIFSTPLTEANYMRGNP